MNSRASGVQRRLLDNLEASFAPDRPSQAAMDTLPSASGTARPQRGNGPPYIESQSQSQSKGWVLDNDEEDDDTYFSSSSPEDRTSRISTSRIAPSASARLSPLVQSNFGNQEADQQRTGRATTPPVATDSGSDASMQDDWLPTRRRYGVRAGNVVNGEQGSPSSTAQPDDMSSGSRRYRNQYGAPSQLGPSTSAGLRSTSGSPNLSQAHQPSRRPSDRNSKQGENRPADPSGSASSAAVAENDQIPSDAMVDRPATSGRYSTASSRRSMGDAQNDWLTDWGWDAPGQAASPSGRPSRDGQAAASTSAEGLPRQQRSQQFRQEVADDLDDGLAGASDRRWWQGFGKNSADAVAGSDQRRRQDEAAPGPDIPAGIWGPEDGPAITADITRLEPAELDLLMPLAPSVPQLQIASGGPTSLLQRCAGSVLGTLVFYKFVLLASASLTFPLWSPVLLAAYRNWDAKKSCRFVGLWRTSVLGVKLKGRRWVTSPSASSGRSITLLLGDDSGLRSSVSLPYTPQCEQIQVGDTAEMLVTSSQRDFAPFKALKEVYLPQTGIWLSDYPLTCRQAFLDVSLAIEDERQQAAPMT